MREKQSKQASKHGDDGMGVCGISELIIASSACVGWTGGKVEWIGDMGNGEREPYLGEGQGG